MLCWVIATTVIPICGCGAVAEPVQQCDRAFDDPSVHAKAGAVFGAAPGDVRRDLQGAHLEGFSNAAVALTWNVSIRRGVCCGTMDGRVPSPGVSPVLSDSVLAGTAGS